MTVLLFDALRLIQIDRRELKETRETLEKKTAQVAEQMASGQRQMHQQLLDQSKSLADDLRLKSAEILSLLERQMQEIRADKTDRSALAAMFTEMAMRLNDEWQFPSPDAEHLLDLDVHTFMVYKERIEKHVLHFALGTAQLSPGEAEKLQRLVADLQAFSAAAQRLGKRFRVTILGHADQSGEVEKNLVLSQQRADYVRAFLVEHGFAEALLSAAGVGPKAPLRIENTEADRAFNRSASLRVVQVDDFNE